MKRARVGCELRRKLSTAWTSSFSLVAAVCAVALPLIGAAPSSFLSPFSGAAFAQAAPSAGASKPPPPVPVPTPTLAPPGCWDAHRQFNFWVGSWDVTPKGLNEPQAVNIITAEHQDCVLRENYKTRSGYTGMSMSFYDKMRGVWHQTWMGADGSALFIEGGLNGKGQMVLSNRNTPYYKEGSPINRVTWTPNANGSVRQHWQASHDGGKTWSDVFDGVYVKRTTKP